MQPYIEKPETLNQRLELMGLVKPSKSWGFTCKGPGLARREAARQIIGRVQNRTNPFLQSEPGLLARYPDPLLTLLLSENAKAKLVNKYTNKV